MDKLHINALWDKVNRFLNKKSGAKVKNEIKKEMKEKYIMGD
jgi:hypothetical protein